MLMNVDLPEPEGPMMAVNSPGCSSNETFSMAANVVSPVAKSRVMP